MVGVSECTGRAIRYDIHAAPAGTSNPTSSCFQGGAAAGSCAVSQRGAVPQRHIPIKRRHVLQRSHYYHHTITRALSHTTSRLIYSICCVCQAWYWGCVTDHRPQDTKFAILYDDGKSEWTDLSRKVFVVQESMMGAAIDRMTNSNYRSTHTAASHTCHISMVREALRDCVCRPRLDDVRGSVGAEEIKVRFRLFLRLFCDCFDWHGSILRRAGRGSGTPASSEKDAKWTSGCLCST